MSALTPVLAVAAKDLRLLARDRAAFIFTFLFPVALAVLFGSMFGGGGDGPARDLEIAVHDRSGSREGEAYIAALSAPGEGLVAAREPSVEACEDRVRSQGALACLVLPADFQGGAEAILAGRRVELELVVDPSRRAEAGLLQGKLMASGYRRMMSGFTDPARASGLLARARASLDADAALPAPARAALVELYEGLDAVSKIEEGTGPEAQGPRDSDGGWQPLAVATRELAARGAEGPPSVYAVTFPQGVAWGLMSCVMAFVGALVRERSRGTMLRLTAAPISPAQVLAGKSLACFTACVAVQLLILLVAALAFGVRVGSPPGMVAALVSASLGFTGLTLLMSGLSRSEEGADGLGRAALMVLALIGGGAVPLAFMPDGMVTASHVSPFKWAVLAFEGALWRGFGPAEMLLPCAILLVLGVLGFVSGTLLLRRSRAE